jgi:hypothetical protein
MATRRETPAEIEGSILADPPLSPTDGFSESLAAVLGQPVVLGEGRILAKSLYLRVGDDLVLHAGDGEVYVIRGYFALDERPDLLSADGGRMTPEMVDAFTVGQSPLDVIAQAEGIVAPGAVGVVSVFEGSATVTRTDGSVEEMAEGTQIFQNDVIETDADSALRVVFLDDMIFALGPESRMAIDEFVFDPGGADGTSAVSVLIGMAMFVSGRIAEADHDDLVITTPVAVIGIRGTVAAMDIQPPGEQSTFTIIEGAILVSNAAGEVILDQPNQTTTVSDFNTLPSEPETLSDEQVEQIYQPIQPVAPEINAFTDVDNEDDASADEGVVDEAAFTGEEEAGEEAAIDPEAAADGEAEEVAEEEAVEEEGAEEETAEETEGEAELAEAEAEGAGTDEAVPDVETAGGGSGTTTDGGGTTTTGGGTGSDGSVGGDTGTTTTTGGTTTTTGGTTTTSGGGTTTSGGGTTTSGGGGTTTTTTTPPPTTTPLPPPPAPGPTFDQTFVGGTGNDNLLGGGGNDLMTGGLGDDNLSGGGGADSMTGGDGNDNLSGGDGGDTLVGDAGADTLTGDAGNDTVFGGAGNDTIIGGSGEGDDVYHGDEGIDTLIYSSAVNPLNINMLTGITVGGIEIGTDIFDGIENIVAGNGDDTIIGDGNANLIEGGPGDDLIDGGGGADTLLGGTGNDTFVFDVNDTTVDGDGGSNALRVDSGQAMDITGISVGQFANIDTIDLTGFGANALALDAASVIALVGNGGTLTIKGDASDSIDAGNGWAEAGTQMIGGQPYTAYTQSGVTIVVNDLIDQLDIEYIAIAPTLNVTSASGDINAPIPLQISASLIDTDGSEVLSFEISDVPATASLSAGTDLGGGTWSLLPADLVGLTLIPSVGLPPNFSLTVTAISTETGNGDEATTVSALPVSIGAFGISIANGVPNPVTEGVNPTVSFTVTLSEALTAPVTLDYTTVDGSALAGDDYVTEAGSLTFAAGETSKDITVTLIDDATLENNESFSVALANALYDPGGADEPVAITDATGFVTVADDDLGVFISDGVPGSVEEGTAGTITFTVTLSQVMAAPVSVDYASANSSAVAGSDYVAVSGSLLFAAGETTKDITVTVLDDGLFESTEAFVMGISNAILDPGGANSVLVITDATGVGTITDDDIGVSIGTGVPSVATEGTDPSITFTVMLSKAAGSDVTVDYTTANGSAVAGADFVTTSGTLTFAAGETSKDVTVQLLDNTVYETPEWLQVQLSNAILDPGGANSGLVISSSTGTATIVDDDIGIFISDGVPYTAVEGSDASVTFTVSLSAAETVPVTVDFTTVNNSAQAGSDYVATSGSLNFAVGETSKEIVVPLLDDGTFEYTEWFWVSLSNAVRDPGGNPEAMTIIDGGGWVPIYDDDGAPPPKPVISAVDSDTGASGVDEITSDATLVISGTAEAGSLVELFVDGNSIGTGTADAWGRWSVDHSATTLADGAYDLTAIASNGNGASPVSNTVTVTVDTTAPTGSTPDLDAASDSGTSNSDNISNETAPLLRIDLGAEALAGDKVQLLLDGTPLAATGIVTLSATDITNGFVDIAVSDGDLGADGVKLISASLWDTAGNQTTTATLSLTLDTTPNVTPAVTGIADDTGISASDAVTFDSTLVFSGTAGTNQTVELFLDGNAIGTTNANGSGNWSFDYTGTVLAKGEYELTVDAISVADDAAGNAPVSDPFSFWVLEPIAWDNDSADGQWLTAANWAGDVLPGQHDYVEIDGAFGAASLNPSSGAYDVASLILTNGADLNAYSSSTYFDLNIGTFATIDASSTLDLGYRSRTTFGETMEVEGTLSIDDGARLAGGTLKLQGAGELSLVRDPSFYVWSVDGVFDGLEVWGDMTIASDYYRLDVVNGLTLHDETGSGNGTLTLQNTYSELAFQGTQTLHAGSIVLDGNTNTNMYVMGADAVVTLAAGAEIIGGTGDIDFQNNATLVNEGSISSEVSGKTLRIGGDYLSGTFQNEGTVQVINGATLEIDTADFVNNATIAPVVGSTLNIYAGAFTIDAADSLSVSGQGTLRIGDGSSVWSNAGTVSALGVGSSLILNGNWSNTGTITTADADVVLDGNFSVSDIATGSQFIDTDPNAGSNSITGNLDLEGDEFTLDAATGSWVLNNGGRIWDGTLKLADGETLSMVRDPSFYVWSVDGTLDGTEVWGDMTIASDYYRLDVFNGLTLLDETGSGNGTLTLQNTYSELAFRGTQTLHAGSIVLDGNTNTNMYVMGTDAVVTLAAGTEIIGGTGDIDFQNNATLVNLGLISAQVSGETLRIGGDYLSGTFQNDGTVQAINGGILEIDTNNFVFNGSIAPVVGSTLNIYAGAFTIGGATGVTVTDQGTLRLGDGNSVWSNLGTVTASDVGSNLILNGTWTNTGTITASDVDVIFDGNFTPDDIAFGTRFIDADPSTGTVRVTGNLDFQSGEYTLDAATGTWGLDNGGKLSDGTLKLADGETLSMVRDPSFYIWSVDGNFDNMTVWGDMTIASDYYRLDVVNGLTLLDESGSGNGTLTLQNTYSELVFQGTQTLHAGSIVLDGTSNTNMHVVGTGAVVTLAAGTEVIGGTGDIDFQNNATLINEGLISSEVSGKTLRVGGDYLSGTFQNEGTVQVINGATLEIDTANFVNNATVAPVVGSTLNIYAGAFTIDAADSFSVSGQGTLRLGDGSSVWDNQGAVTAADVGTSLILNGTWANTGSITVSDADVMFDGNFTAADIAIGTRFIDTAANAGSVRVTGNLDFAGGELTLDATTGTWGLDNGGRLSDGTLKLADGETLSMVRDPSFYVWSIDGNFDNMTVWGDMTIASDYYRLDVVNGLTLLGESGSGNGTLTLQNTYSELVFQGTQTLHAGSIVLDGTTNTNMHVMGSGAVVTLATGTEVIGGIGDIELQNNATLINQGLISAQVSGETLRVGGSYLSGSLENHGDIEAIGGGILDVRVNAFTLFADGTVSVSGASTLRLGATNSVWLNEDAMTASGAGTQLVFGGTWSNTGSITVSDADVTFGGNFTASDIAIGSRFIDTDIANGDVRVTGNLDLEGGDFTLGAATGTWGLENGGRISDGTLKLADGETLSMVRDPSFYIWSVDGNFDNMTVWGDLTIASDYYRLDVVNGLTLLDETGSGNGTLTLQSNYAELVFQGTQTLHAGSIVLDGNTNTNMHVMGSGAVVTLATGTEVIGGIGDIEFQNNATLINQGLISAQVSGETLRVGGNHVSGTLENHGNIEAIGGGILDIRVNAFTLFADGTVSVSGASTLRLGRAASTWLNEDAISASGAGTQLVFGGTWSNTGSITVSDADVTFGGNFTASDIAIGSRFVDTDIANGDVRVTGNLDLEGGEFTLDAATGTWGLENGGRLSDGTLKLADGETLSLVRDPSFNIWSVDGNFDDMTVWGDLTIASDYYRLDVFNGLTLLDETGSGNGTLTLQNNYSEVIFQGTQTLHAGSIVLDGNTNTNVFFTGAGTVVTLAVGSEIIGGIGDLEFQNNVTLINQGLISAEVSGETLRIGGNNISGSLDNQGTVQAGDGATLQIRTTTWSNSGTVAASGVGTHLDIGGTWSNTGTITVSDADLSLGGNFTASDVTPGTRFVDTDLANGTVRVSGNLDLEGGDLTLNASSGSWHLANGGTLLNGILKFADGESLSLVRDPSFNIWNVDGNFDDMTVWGDLTIASDYYRLDVFNDLTLLDETGSGNGTLTLQNTYSELVFQGTQTLHAGSIVLDGNTNTNVFFSGTGSIVTLAAGTEIIGGTGDLEFQNNATLINEGLISAEASGETLRVGGNHTNGTLVNSGTLQAINGANLALGVTFTSAVAMLADGIESDITYSKDFSLGWVGTATLDVTDGGDLTQTSSGRTVIGGVNGTDAVVTVDGANGINTSTFDAGNLLVIAESYEFGSSTRGGVGSGGSATITLGEFGILKATNIYLGSGGTLGGDGSIVGTLTLEGGVIGAGSSAGTLSHTGNLVLDSGYLINEIGGTTAGAYDFYDASGDVTLDGGVLVFDFINGFVPAANDAVVFLQADGSVNEINGDFAHAVVGVQQSFSYTVAFSDIGNDTVMDGVFTALNSDVGGTSTLFTGGGGDDLFASGAGDDILDGGLGNDILSGGGGADLFLYDLLQDEGSDAILDFSTADGDIFHFENVTDVDNAGNTGTPDSAIDFNDVVEAYVNDGGGSGIDQMTLESGTMIFIGDLNDTLNDIVDIAANSQII